MKKCLLKNLKAIAKEKMIFDDIQRIIDFMVK